VYKRQLNERVRSLKNEMREAVEDFIRKVSDVMDNFSKTVNKETNKIVENVERITNISSEITRLRRGQRRLLTLIIIQMILQTLMIYLFFFR